MPTVILEFKGWSRFEEIEDIFFQRGFYKKPLPFVNLANNINEFENTIEFKNKKVPPPNEIIGEFVDTGKVSTGGFPIFSFR